MDEKIRKETGRYDTGTLRAVSAVAQELAVQVMDETRYTDDFQFCALANGGGLLKSLPGFGVRPPDNHRSSQHTVASAFLHASWLPGFRPDSVPVLLAFAAV